MQKEGAMYQTMKVFKKVLVASFMLLMPVFMAANSGLAMDMEAGHDMSSHHQHIMLNHALGMTLEGYNLVMLGDMGMARGVDEVSVEHGNMMIKNGKAMWTEIMSGKTMTGMHHSGKDPMKDPAMAYTHKLGEKQLIVMDLLGKMPNVGDGQGEGGHGMAVHHQHIMLNHALKMALEGANSVMLGDMGMAKGVDSISVEHGKMMLKNARALFNDIMSGKTMMNMHMDGTTPESDALMKYTHKLAEAQLQVITLLDDMPGVK
jgi:polyhydroxyalkanoate synthesis regulator phasin